MASEVDLAWAAGFIDGEGCINITKRYAKYKGREGGKLYHSVSLSVSQISKEPLLKLQEMFGGRIRPIKPTGNRRPSFSWMIYTKSARDALKQMLPYFKVKEIEARMVLLLDFTSSRISEEEWELRDNVEAYLKSHHNGYIWSEGLGD